MNVHKNANLTPRGRGEIVRRVVDLGQAPKAVATALGACERTVRKWVRRFQTEGYEGLQDRSSRPHTLRRRRCTGAQIAAHLGVSIATVSRVLLRLGLNRLKDLDPPEPVRRYERQHPGELIHIDITKLGRFDRPGHRVTGDRTGQSNYRDVGWEYLHICIDDHSRVAFSQILPDERKQSATAFLNAAVAYHQSLGVAVTRVMIDNGACCKAHTFRAARKAVGLKHIRTRPYTPKTNGKAERFIRTALRAWAYARAYRTSSQRAQQLPQWMHRYNWHRPHGSLKANTPISRLRLA